MTSRVRPAAVGDAERLAVVHARVWRETYTGVMPEAVLARMDDPSHVQRWHDHVSAPPVDADVPFRLLVGVDGGEVVAFAAAGRRSDDDGPRPLQLYAINVLRSHLGRAWARSSSTRRSTTRRRTCGSPPATTGPSRSTPATASGRTARPRPTNATAACRS